jgi:hypothetical protein
MSATIFCKSYRDSKDQEKEYRLVKMQVDSYLKTNKKQTEGKQVHLNVLNHIRVAMTSFKVLHNEEFPKPRTSLRF